VIGTGDYLDTIRQLVARKQLDRCVSFIDQVPVQELPRLLSEADVGLVPNRASNATHLMLPVKLLDYAALGIPAIAARLRTIERYFGDRAVRFFEPDDAGDLAAAIEELHRDRARRAELAHNARLVLERIGWPVQRAEYYRAIDALLQKSAARQHPEPAAACGRARDLEEEVKWNTVRR
jgi:glycosyltransferase involved in cell wall biosynthesis